MAFNYQTCSFCQAVMLLIEVNADVHLQCVLENAWQQVL